MSLAELYGGSGGQCPECRESGKSAIEVVHYEVAKSMFSQVASGARLRNEKFRPRASWTADIVALDAVWGKDLVIEYDGAYWHADKVDVGTDKTVDLLTAGYMVCCGQQFASAGGRMRRVY